MQNGGTLAALTMPAWIWAGDMLGNWVVKGPIHCDITPDESVTVPFAERVTVVPVPLGARMKGDGIVPTPGTLIGIEHAG